MSTTDLNLDTMCQQRRKQILFNVPPIRYNPISPYSGNVYITQSKLDMRRKAEILQYSANKTNTKTNKYTKSEKWSLLVSGKNQPKQYNNITITEVRYIPSVIGSENYAIAENGNIVNVNLSSKYSSIPLYNNIVVEYPDTYERIVDNISGNITYNIIKGNIPECNTDMIPTPTSSSDVPGPIINLFRDVSIPLYNYSTNVNSYGLINEENNTKYRYIINKNIEFTNGVESSLFSLNIINNNDEYRNTFGFDVPLSIYFKSTIKNTNVTDNKIWSNVIINVSYINLKVYYNNSTVNLDNQTNISIPDISNIYYDISLNKDITYSSNYTYSGLLYLGVLQVSNLYLYTQPGYVYDIKLTFTITTQIKDSNNTSINLSNDVNYTNYFNNLNTTIIANPINITKTSTNCNITTNNSNTTNNGFTLYGY
jgi:hypothetical protein